MMTRSCTINMWLGTNKWYKVDYVTLNVPAIRGNEDKSTLILRTPNKTIPILTNETTNRQNIRTRV